jgi:hypothetical protein
MNFRKLGFRIRYPRPCCNLVFVRFPDQVSVSVLQFGFFFNSVVSAVSSWVSSLVSSLVPV